MTHLSTITLLGNVGNVETIRTKNGKEIIRFSVGVTRKEKDKEVTDWYDVKTAVPWAKEAIQKGNMVLIVGEPRTRIYNERKYFSVWADKIKVLRRKNTQNKTKQTDEIDELYEDSDIPF